VIKDIDPPKVENIALAAVPEPNPETGVDEWYIYLINLKDTEITNVIVASRGYGVVKKEKVETSQLRHHVEAIPPSSYVKIEPIMDNLFPLNNQYWVSFFVGQLLFDKKYIFVPNSIAEENLIFIEEINLSGVIH
jgi:hypothetical protein